MKSKLKKGLKAIFFVALFCCIYVGTTFYVENAKRDAVVQLESDTKLDTLVNDLIVKTFKDSLAIDNYKGYSTAIDSLKEGSYKPMKAFLYDRNIDSTSVNKFVKEAEEIVTEYQANVSLLTEYKREHNNLLTRFPSNIILGNYKSLK